MADTDILTPDEARAAILASGRPLSAEVESVLATMITAATSVLEEHTGPVVVRAVDETILTNGHAHVFLKYRPVDTLSSVTEYDQAGTPTVLAVETHASKPAQAVRLAQPALAGMLERRASGWPSRFPVQGTLLVTYDAGRYADTAAVAPVFKQMAQGLLQHVWQQSRGGMPVQTFDGAIGQSPVRWAVPDWILGLAPGELLGPARIPGIA